MNGVPVEDGPVEDGPVEDGPVEDGPVEDGPVEDGPVEDGPVEDGPVEDGPVEDGPVEDGPVEDGPVGQAELDLAPLRTAYPPHVFFSLWRAARSNSTTAAGEACQYVIYKFVQLRDVDKRHIPTDRRMPPELSDWSLRLLSTHKDADTANEYAIVLHYRLMRQLVAQSINFRYLHSVVGGGIIFEMRFNTFHYCKISVSKHILPPILPNHVGHQDQPVEPSGAPPPDNT